MHTEGIEEHIKSGEQPAWFLRWECRGCGLRVGLALPVSQAEPLVDRIMWTDEARHRLERWPPYVAPMFQEQIESYARVKQWRAITFDRLVQAGTGDLVTWDAEAEARLARVPAPVRAMARVELERTAADRGQAIVTVQLMEEVKARYFGMGQKG